MAGGYDTKPVDPLAQLMEELRGLKARVAELERPTGTQIAEVVANATSPLAAHADAGGFSLTGTAAELTRTTIDVPAGYTRAMVVAVTGVSARNSQSGFDISMTAQVDINGEATGRLTQTTVFELSFGMVTNGAAAVLEELGSTFYVRTLAYTAGPTFATNASNAVNLDVSVLFLR